MTGSPYWSSVRKADSPQPEPKRPNPKPVLSAEEQIIAEAIARGDATGRALIAARDKLFEPMREILRIAGFEGLRACVLGVEIAVWREITGGRK